MDFVLQNWMLIAVAFVSGGMLVWPLVSRGMGGSGSVDPNRAVQMINRDKATVIDVSEPDEFASGHVVGSRNLPVAGVESGAAGLPSNKALPVILVCPTGGRAGRAAATLRKRGFQSVHVLAGGLNAWRAAGLPLEKGAQAQGQPAQKQPTGKASGKSAGKGGGKAAGKSSAKVAGTAQAEGAEAAGSAQESGLAVSEAPADGSAPPEGAAQEDGTRKDVPQGDTAQHDAVSAGEDGRAGRPPGAS